MMQNYREFGIRGIMFVVAVLIWAIVGYLAASAEGTTFAAIADGNCIEQPSLPIPAGVDPNKIAGHLIDVLDVTAGKFNRVGRFCDPQGFPVEVELLAAPAGFGVTIDVDAATWTIAGEIPPGAWGIVARGRNVPRAGEPNDVIVTVYVRARPPINRRPILR